MRNNFDVFGMTCSSCQAHVEKAVKNLNGVDKVTVNLLSNEMVEKAIHFATECHCGQTRKGTNIPYIFHPLEVVQILYSMRSDNNLIIAGVLHDVVEDTDTTLDEIKEIFGEDVAALVASNSEDKSKSWKERKQHTHDELPYADIRVKKLILADKLSNQRSLVTDYAKIGDELWKRFNVSDKKMQAWYYGGIQDALFELQNDDDCKNAYWELVDTYKDVFVDFYYDERRQVIYQKCADGSTFKFEKGTPDWLILDGQIPNTAVPVHRRVAERMEDNWSDLFKKING